MFLYFALRDVWVFASFYFHEQFPPFIARPSAWFQSVAPIATIEERNRLQLRSSTGRAESRLRLRLGQMEDRSHTTTNTHVVNQPVLKQLEPGTFNSQRENMEILQHIAEETFPGNSSLLPKSHICCRF